MTREFLPGVGRRFLMAASLICLGLAGLAAAGLAQVEIGSDAGDDDEASPGSTDFDATTEGTAASEEVAKADAEQEASSLLADFYQDLKLENLRQKVEQTYAPTAVREDPTGSFDGRDRILGYYQGLLGSMESFEAEIKDEFVSGDETIALWHMRIKHASLGAEPVVVEGVSHLRIHAGRIVSQRDYFDLGAAYYEHLTMIGSVIRWLKAKLLP